MGDISTLISTLGFPIFGCIALGYFVKHLIDMNNTHIERMFTMYDQANKENREAVEACTKAIEKLCDKIEERGIDHDKYR